MKAFLMHKDRDFDLQGKLPSNEQTLTQDLELNTLFKAMALEDEFLLKVSQSAVLSGLNNDPATILYRQDILKDCLKNSSIIRGIYALTTESLEIRKKSFWGIYNRYSSPGMILHSAVEFLRSYVDLLKRIKSIANEHEDKFESEGFKRFFTMLNQELEDEYFVRIQDHLRRLKFQNGVLISADLGTGNEGTHFVLRKPQQIKNEGWMKRLFARKPPVYTFSIHPRDESGARALSELTDQGINLVANALAQSADHILSFFNLLRTELAFYVAGLNLQEQLAQMGEPIAFPLPSAPGRRSHSFKGLYDICLALTMKQKIVGNDVEAGHKNLVIVTGANQGGKSTFLRSIGLAQLMMQCGLFVPAESFRADICDGLFTHYKREEDISMKSGKLDEELSRMNELIGQMTSNPMILFNESFAATNEREGSEIARQITSALLEKGLKVFFVTHLYQFAHHLFEKQMKNALFLRAERQADGGRTFKLIEGEPLETSFGQDLYREVFGPEERLTQDPYLTGDIGNEAFVQRR
jgi:DNA mismatch repair ATPase MutS